MAKAAKRPFRSEASYAFEKRARNAVRPFLESRGIEVLDDQRVTVGRGESQLIVARMGNGDPVAIRVRLCWRKDGRNPREHLYSAAQLRARTVDGDWTATLNEIVSNNRSKGVTHILLLQALLNPDTVVQAALVPIDLLSPVWHTQRDVSEQLIRGGKLGRVHKNHAANGDSPTIWLRDERSPDAHQVPDVLWNWPGVIDLVALPGVDSAVVRSDDTFDDCPGLSDEIGTDSAPKVTVTRSNVRRDRKVRDAVRKRANGRCERCTASRDFEGFLDVHHIMGVEKSDRVWTCVALCPNCHREAHISKEADDIRRHLSLYAEQFRTNKRRETP